MNYEDQKNVKEIAKIDRQLDRLHDAEYAAGRSLELLSEHEHAEFESSLHLAVSMRSFRAENFAKFVHKLLDRDVEGAREAYQTLDKYPIVLLLSLFNSYRSTNFVGKDFFDGPVHFSTIIR